MTNFILELAWYTRLIWDISDITGCVTVIISAMFLLLIPTVGVLYAIVHKEIKILYGSWSGFIKFLVEKDKENETVN